MPARHQIYRSQYDQTEGFRLGSSRISTGFARFYFTERQETAVILGATNAAIRGE